MTTDFTFNSHNLNLSDLPNYYTTFAGIVCSTMTLAFDDAIVDSIIPPLMDLFNLPQEIRDFINNQYLPEVRDKCCPENTLIMMKCYKFSRSERSPPTSALEYWRRCS